MRIRKVPLLVNTPEDEILAKYYATNELVGIRNKLRAQIRVLVEQGVGVEAECHHNGMWDYRDDSAVFCMRGLEHEFPKGKARRHDSKNSSRAAALQEQEAQWDLEWKKNNNNNNTNCEEEDDEYEYEEIDYIEEGCSDDEQTGAIHANAGAASVLVSDDPTVAIAEVYREKSRSAMEHALVLAKRDEAFAKRFCNNTVVDSDDDDSDCE